MSTISRNINFGSSAINYDYIERSETSLSDIYDFYAGGKTNPNKKLLLKIVISFTDTTKDTIEDVDYQRQ